MIPTHISSNLPAQKNSYTLHFSLILYKSLLLSSRSSRAIHVGIKSVMCVMCKIIFTDRPRRKHATTIKSTTMRR